MMRRQASVGSPVSDIQAGDGTTGPLRPNLMSGAVVQRSRAIRTAGLLRDKVRGGPWRRPEWFAGPLAFEGMSV
jgi:hypothetical protein